MSKVCRHRRPSQQRLLKKSLTHIGKARKYRSRRDRLPKCGLEYPSSCWWHPRGRAARAPSKEINPCREGGEVVLSRYNRARVRRKPRAAGRRWTAAVILAQNGSGYSKIRQQHEDNNSVSGCLTSWHVG